MSYIASHLFPIPHQMLILCVETSLPFHEPLIIGRRLRIRGNISRLAEKKEREKERNMMLVPTVCKALCERLFKKVMLSF